jgi:ubiquinone/menaquinone biosynthesis C-methylase UbiE
MGSSADVGKSATPVRRVVKGLFARALDRMVAVGYGVVYDYIFEQFGPYQSLQQEVMELVESAVPDSTNRRDVRILELGCGPGNLALRLAEAGFTVFGLDRYGSLIDLAREKRQARRLANLSFQHGDLAKGMIFRDAAFDQIVNVHSLYVHPEPDRKLKEAFRVLKPAGHAVFVNHTRRVELRATFRELRAREGMRPAISSLLWVVPNAVFEAARHKVGPTYWEEDEFTAHLQAAGFTVLETRRTFLNDASLLIWARKDSPE